MKWFQWPSCSLCCRSSRHKRDSSLLWVGLDYAGKSSILFRLKNHLVVNTIPTIGHNLEFVQVDGMKFTVWDLPGRDIIRPLWKHYFEFGNGIVFVIDSTDRRRMDDVKDEIERLLGEELLKNSPILIYANKQDLTNCMSETEITEILSMNEKELSVQWHIQPCSAVNGNGIQEGLRWLAQQLV